jgi:predicted nucleic acid-binding protein
LQRIFNLKEYHQVSSVLQNLIFLNMSWETHVAAAEIYRTLRRRGITIRKTIDCMIAAVALENDIPLLHRDRDFDPIKKYCGLKIYEPIS